jgi:hypothetical protein
MRYTDPALAAVGVLIFASVAPPFPFVITTEPAPAPQTQYNALIRRGPSAVAPLSVNDPVAVRGALALTSVCIAINFLLKRLNSV